MYFLAMSTVCAPCQWKNMIQEGYKKKCKKQLVKIRLKSGVGSRSIQADETLDKIKKIRPLTIFFKVWKWLISYILEELVEFSSSSSPPILVPISFSFFLPLHGTT